MISSRGLLLLSMASSGCSFLLVRRAPNVDTWPTEHVKADLAPCTRWPVVPIIDAAIGLPLVAAGTAFIFAPRADDGAEGIALATYVVAAPFIVSSIYGLVATGHCRTYLAGPPYPFERARGKSAAPDE